MSQPPVATDVSVIIVSYNTADLLIACLQSVLASKQVALEIFVVDNASKDSSANIVREQFSTVHLIANKDNRGFGAANNQALHECSGKYVLFLNPDTTIEPDSLQTMIEFMESHPAVGLAGPKVLNPDGTRQDSVSLRYPGHRYGAADLGELPGEIACVLGACQIASRELLQQIGCFDEDFFLYGEDQDICLRIRKRGLAIGVIPEAAIMHHGGQSERDTLPAEVVRKKIKAEYLFYRKHYKPESIKKIRRAQHLRAFWRIFSIHLSQYAFFWGRDSLLHKLSRYRIIYYETRSDICGKKK